MTLPEVPSFVVPELAKLQIEISAEELNKLAAYLDLLLKTNEQFNLTAIRDPDQAWRRHIIDSLTLLPFLSELQQGATVTDVGSGGGLPGIPLAITRPDLRFTLIESTGKKARFLQQCAKELSLPNVKVLNERAENVGKNSQYRETFTVAVCRAVGPMSELLEYTLPLVEVGGSLLAMKGPKAEAELDEAADAMTILGAGEFEVHDAYPPEFEQHSVVVVIAKAMETPEEFPRQPGLARQAPLGEPLHKQLAKKNKLNPQPQPPRVPRQDFRKGKQPHRPNKPGSRPMRSNNPPHDRPAK